MVTKLIVASGKSAGRSISIKRNKLLIGRAEECDVRPLSEEVSRRHCAVIVGPADVWIEDLGSRNGTLVNGSKITAKTRLSDGDLIRVGSLELRVSCTRPAPAGGEEDVSRWLLADEEASSAADTTRSTPDAGDVGAGEAATAGDTGNDGATDAGESSFVGGIESSPADPADSAVDDSSVSRTASTIQELKAARDKPGSLPQAAGKKSDSSRDAAAEALKKFFDRK
jgi:pSer/pThr/pTyr-binding forkhead associated (FHA) protein